MNAAAQIVSEMLAIGRASVANPRLLLVEEPSQGLAPLVVAELHHILGNVGELRGDRERVRTLMGLTDIAV